jgi:hypothetical protein
MRSVRGNRNLLATSAAVVLVVVAGVGCGGDEASSRQELPGVPQPVATIVDDGRDGLLPGDQRAPGSASVTTTPTRPIGRPLNPVPVHRTPVTRPPSRLTEVVTTTSTPPAIPATAPITPG